nr:ribonuclease H-like domain-containing protein [Tanacetum cinerariifolium]
MRLNRYKARLVANGRSQQEGIDCDETFSPVVKLATIRIVLSLAVSRQWSIHQLVVKNAFLHDHLTESVYMHQPPGFAFCKSRFMALSRPPELGFNNFLAMLFEPVSITAKLTPSSTSLLQRIISLLHAEFAMTDLGPLNYFLGISATRTTSGIFLSEKKYATEILEQAQMLNCNPCRTLIDTEKKLGPERSPVTDPTLYRSLAGSLQVVGGVVVVCGDGVDSGVEGVDCGVCGFVCGGVKAPVSLMIVRVPEKDRWCGTRVKFVRWKGVRGEGRGGNMERVSITRVVTTKKGLTGTIISYSETIWIKINGAFIIDEPTIEASNSNPFDVLNSVENDVDLVTNGGTSNLASKNANSSGSLFWNVKSSSTSITFIIEKIKRLIIDGKVTLVNDEGKPLAKVDSSSDDDSEDEVASVWNWSVARYRLSMRLVVAVDGDWFATYEEFDDEHVFMGNDSPCKVVGIGTIQIKMHDGVFRNLAMVNGYRIWSQSQRRVILSRVRHLKRITCFRVKQDSVESSLRRRFPKRWNLIEMRKLLVDFGFEDYVAYALQVAEEVESLESATYPKVITSKESYAKCGRWILLTKHDSGSKRDVVLSVVDYKDLKKFLISRVLDLKGFKYTNEDGVLRVSKEKSKSNLTMFQHMRLGHVSEKGMVVLIKWGLLGSHKVANLEFCEHCVIGKQKRVFMMKYKSEAFEKFKHWKVLNENQTEKINRLRIDNGEEVESLAPATYREAITSKEFHMWSAAMGQEIESLHKNNIWELAGYISRDECRVMIYGSSWKRALECGETQFCYLKGTCDDVGLIYGGWRLLYCLEFSVVLNKIGLISYGRNRTIYEVTICQDYMTLFQDESEMALKLEEELYFQCLARGASVYVCTLLRRFSYLPEARVFEQNINAFLDFLKSERIFGAVTEFCIEFQMHGLPQCHTLMWVDSASKIQEPEDVDRVILAELPDPQIDPHGYKVVSEMMIHGPCGAVNMSATYSHLSDYVTCAAKDVKEFKSNGMRAAVEAIGSFNLIIPNGLVIVLDNCHYAPSITRDVVSLSCLVDNGCKHTFMNYAISVMKDDVFYFNEIPRYGIYEIEMHDLYSNVVLYTICALKNFNVMGILHPNDDESFDKCKSYISGNMARKPFPHQVERAKELLGLIHTNVCGPFRIVSREGTSYFITFTDDFIRNGYVYLMKHKHEGYALEYAARILDMVLTKKVAFVKRDTLDKLEPKSVKCIFIGYLKETIGYYFYNPYENKNFVARYAEFFKNSLTLQEASMSLTLHEASGSDVGLELLQELDTQPSKDTSEQHDEILYRVNGDDFVENYVTAKLMTEVVTAAAPTTTDAQVPKPSAPRRRRGVVIQDPKETASVIVHTKKEEEEVTVQEKEIEEEGESLEQKIAKKQRIDEEAEELKRHLQIVANDDVYNEATPLASKGPVVDYHIHHENNKPYYKIIRADKTHKLFLSFITLLKNFDREDLENLWKLVKERFKTTEPKNFSDDFLLNILKIMFEKPNVEASI